MDDWNVGDNAQCVVHPDWWEMPGEVPGFLTIHEVVRVDSVVCVFRGPMVGLQFSAFGNMFFWSIGFRKVNPIDEDESREETRELEHS